MLKNFLRLAAPASICSGSLQNAKRAKCPAIASCSFDPTSKNADGGIAVTPIQMYWLHVIVVKAKKNL